MKTFKNYVSFFGVLWIVLSFMGCEQKISIESAVEEDGAIDRTIIFTEVDSAKVTQNIFGIRAGNGWTADIELFGRRDDSVARKDVKYNITFRKHFNSVSEANDEFNSSVDSLFHIRSSFEKKFRWFYTYIYYSDTYASINRFKYSGEFFTPEDYAFINRLPAEGRSISKADSIYLENLTEKVYGQYVLLAMFEEHFQIVLQAAEKNGVGKQWIDSLHRHKSKMYSYIVKHADDDDDAFSKAFMIHLMDTLDIPFPVEKIKKDYQALYRELLPRWNFMITTSQEATFTHAIKLPWDIVDTNADSVSSSAVYWKPPMMKFSLRDYTMYVTARKLNYWTVVVSLVVVMVAILGLIRRRKPKV